MFLGDVNICTHFRPVEIGVPLADATEMFLRFVSRL
jgi:hypothetical protein